jgi:hypothetical protein
VPALDGRVDARLASCQVQVQEAALERGPDAVQFALAAEAAFPVTAHVRELAGEIQGYALEAREPPVVTAGEHGFAVSPCVFQVLGGNVALAAEGDWEGALFAWSAGRGLAIGCLLEPLGLHGHPEGVASFDARLDFPAVAGTPPAVEARVEVRDAAWTIEGKRLTGGSASLDAATDEQGIVRAAARAAQGPSRVRVDLELPLVWRGGPGVESGATARASFAAEIAEFADLPLEPRAFRDLGGAVRADGRVTARLAPSALETLANASWTADLTIAGGRLKPRSAAPPLTSVEAAIRIEDDEILVRCLRGEVRGTPFLAEGKARWRRPSPEREGGIAEVDIDLKADNALLVRTGKVRARGDVDLKWRGPWEASLLSGDVRVVRAYYVEDVSLIATRAVRLPFHLFAFDEEPLSGVRFDVRVRGDRSLIIRNNLVSTKASVDLNLRGFGREPLLVGIISTDEGTVTFGNASLDIKNSIIELVATDPLNPRLNVLLGREVRGYSATVAVTGTLEHPEVLLDSTPPLEREQVLILITTGLTVEDIEAQGVDRVAAVQAATYVGRRIARYFGGGDPSEPSFFDRLTIRSESARSQQYEDPLRVELRVFENILLRRDEVFLQGERDTYGDYNMSAGFRFELD